MVQTAQLEKEKSDPSSTSAKFFPHSKIVGGGGGGVVVVVEVGVVS